MKTTEILGRLADLGSAKWGIYLRAKAMIAEGADVISLTIGEPDVPVPPELLDTVERAMRAGRTGYSSGAGEPGLRRALAERYSRTAGRTISPDQVLCFPGTQTALFAALLGVAEAGDEVLVGDPMYATYAGVIRATGAEIVPVPLRPEHGFRIAARDIEDRITPASRAILLTTPHNPTGAILSAEDIAEIAALALKHDLWIVSDEVYEELVFEGETFTSPLFRPDIADRVVVVSSISKSHAATGFRSGWSIGPDAFTRELLSLSETMLFGNQPFIADMTEAAIRNGSSVARGMAARYAARARRLAEQLNGRSCLSVLVPQAGMFAMIDVSRTGLDGETYAHRLLDEAGVAVMPGSSFGDSIGNWVRVALTAGDAEFEVACDRIARHAAGLARGPA